MIRIFLKILFVFSVSFSTFAQDVAIGQWRSHLPFKSAISVDIAGDLVYCATATGLFSYNKSDQSVERFTKVNRLSDVNINAIRYNSQFDVLVIGYTNGNIDLFYPNDLVNLSDIKRKPIFGNKSINNISFYGSCAYLSCAFGIVVLDLQRQEIKDTYYIGPNGTNININDIACDGTKIYAATDNGILWAYFNSNNLANFNNWKSDTLLALPNGQYSFITLFNDTLIASLSVAGFGQDTLYAFTNSQWMVMDTNLYSDIHSVRVSNRKLIVCYNYETYIYNDSLKRIEAVWNYAPGDPQPKCAIQDADQNYWIADGSFGLVRFKDWSVDKIYPNGPARSDAFNMTIRGSDLYVAPGGVNSAWGNIWNTSGIFSFLGNTWYSLKESNAAFDTLFDIISVAIDPSDNTHVFAGSYASGLAEIKNGYVVKIYNQTNSALEFPNPNYHWLGISGLAFDENNTLWCANAGSNRLLKAMKPDGSWHSFNMSPYISQARSYDIMIDKNNQKWVLLTNSPGILVFNENGTFSSATDDVIRVLSKNLGNGNLPSNLVLSVAEDEDGKIWIGTDAGVSVIHNPENISGGGNFDAQEIKIVQDGVTQLLLQFESVTAIAVDGANKKWFGTEKAGVFYMNEDGTQELLHFTEENSPLLSNRITDIVIDDNTGEVFFSTANGIISYKSNATKGGETISSVYAYPNPVREGFNGMVGIKGLMRNTTVKITDAAGILVYETKSEGGQAVWNCTGFSGEKVKSGVYFVFCSSEDGSEKLATKIMVLY